MEVGSWKLEVDKRRQSGAGSMADTTRRAVVVTLSGGRNVHEVARDLKAAGLEIDSILAEIGVVTGSAGAGQLRALREVRGVADVSPDHPVDIGPPGNPVS